MAKKPEIKKEEKKEEAVVEKKASKKGDMYDKVRIEIPCHIKISRRRLGPGVHEVERHQVDTIREMVDKKVKTDLAIFTGKSYLLKKLHGVRIVKEVAELKIK